jgi:hypothetical protein
MIQLLYSRVGCTCATEAPKKGSKKSGKGKGKKKDEDDDEDGDADTAKALNSAFNSNHAQSGGAQGDKPADCKTQ